jgi:hypothetical protein
MVLLNKESKDNMSKTNDMMLLDEEAIKEISKGINVWPKILGAMFVLQCILEWI